jgi:methylmalonyl-CoA carboxyltransferase large subunit
MEPTMASETLDLAHLANTLEEVRRELARLGDRVAALEAAGSLAPPRSPNAEKRDGDQGGNRPAVPAPPAEALSEELILVIGAAIAAFLGKKPHIRQIRLVGSAAWAQQGRITIQASHALAGQHR